MLAWSEVLRWGWVSTAALFGFHHPARLLDSSFLLVAYTNQKSGLKGDPVSGAADSMGRDWEAPLQGFSKHGCMMGMATRAFVSGARPASSPTGKSLALQSSAGWDLGGESVCSQLWGGHLQYVRKEAGQDPRHIWRAQCKMEILPLVPKLLRMSRGRWQSMKPSWATLLSAGHRPERPSSRGI